MIVSSLTRLKYADDFSSVFILRNRFGGQFINIFYKPSQLEFNRFGLIVSKKINKKAVDRNYMKRVIRDVFRQFNYPSKLDIIIQVKKNFVKKDYVLVKKDIYTFLEAHAK